MLIKLENITGLSDEDPLHRWVKLVDKIVKNDNRWDEIHRRLSQEKLIELMWDYLGHPHWHPELKIEQVGFLIDRLISEDEPKFANILDGLMKQGLTASQIRSTIMFIFVNIDLIKEKEGEIRSYRTIDAGSPE